MEKENYYIVKKKLYLKDNLIVNAKGLIIDFLVLENYIILLLDSKDSKTDRNIFGYNIYSGIYWQVSMIPKIHSENYFTSIYLGKENEILAYNINGVEVTINKENGLILKKELIR